MTAAQLLDEFDGLIWQHARSLSRRCFGPFGADDLHAIGQAALIHLNDVDVRWKVGWSVRCAMIDAIRKINRDPRDPERRASRPRFVSEEALRCVPADGLTPDRSALLSDSAQYIRQAVRALPPRESDVIESIYLRGETRDSVARRWGVAGPTVSAVKSRALERLKSRLGTYDKHF